MQVPRETFDAMMSDPAPAPGLASFAQARSCRHRNTRYDRSICGLCDAAYDFCTDCGADVTQHTCGIWTAEDYALD